MKRKWLYGICLTIGVVLTVAGAQLAYAHDPRWPIDGWAFAPLPGIITIVATASCRGSAEWFRGYQQGVDDGNSRATDAALTKAQRDGQSYGYAEGLQEGRLLGLTEGVKAGWAMAQNPTVSSVVEGIIEGEEASE